MERQSKPTTGQTSEPSPRSESGRRQFPSLRTRANEYPRLNQIAEEEKKERLAKLAQTTGVIRRRSSSSASSSNTLSSASSSNALSSASTSSAFSAASSSIGTVPSRIATMSSRLQQQQIPAFSRRHSIPRTPPTITISALNSANINQCIPIDNVPSTEEITYSTARSDITEDIQHQNTDFTERGSPRYLEKERAQPYDTYPSLTSCTRRNEETPAMVTTSYRQSSSDTYPGQDVGIQFQGIKQVLSELSHRMDAVEARTETQEQVQKDMSDSLVTLENRLQNIKDTQDGGFRSITEILMSLKEEVTQNRPIRNEELNEEKKDEKKVEKEEYGQMEKPATGQQPQTGVSSQIPQSVKEETVPNGTSQINIFSQHKADKPEKYDGKVKGNALEKWIQLVENYARATKMNQEELLLFAISNVKDQASDWWLATSINQAEKGEEITTFKEMKALMRAYFADHASKQDAISKLRVLQEKTSVTGYTQEFLRLRLLCPEISNEIATKYYVEGLSADIRAHVALKAPKTVDEAVEAAILAATAIRKKSNMQEERQNVAFQRRGKQQQRRTSTNTQSVLQNEKKFEKKFVKREQKTCHYCKKPGHLMAECRKKIADEKNKGKTNGKPIRKNNVQRDEYMHDDYSEDYSDSDSTAIKVNCLSYSCQVQRKEERRELLTTAYDKNQAVPNELITLIAHINGRKARILVDSGAGGNFISEEFIKIFRIRKNKLSQPIKIQYADKRKEQCQYEVRNAQLTIGHYNTEIPLIVAPLAYDAILGKPWLAQENPEINWRSNKVWVVKENTRIPLPIRKSEGKNRNGQNMVKPVSLVQFENETNEHDTRIFLITIQEGKEEKPDPFKTSTQPEMAKRIMNDYPSVFCEEHPGGLPEQTNVQHTIEIEGDEKPPCRPMQLMSQAELTELKKQLDAYLEKGWIKPSDSPYGAPVLFALKKDGSKRLCIDYRALNKITKKSKYPLPRFEELQSMIGNANLFSKIDLSNGYHQVRMAEADMHKTAFRTRFGQYEWKVMPFGLTNAPATFQRLINNVLQPLQNKSAAGILDDILIFTTGTKEQHDKDVREVVELLKKYHLIAKPKKCAFFEEEVEYWGHVVTKNGWTTEKSKIQAIINWPCPLPNVHAVRSFLGMCAYYRRYVKDFTLIAIPLYELVRKEGEFLWTKKCEQAVTTLKEKLASAPVLKVADHTKPFVVTTDASHYAIGAVLQQYDENGDLKPVAYESRKLKVNRNAKNQDMGEVRYPTHEKEMLAIIHAAKVWRHLLLGNKVTFYTDHMPLKYLQKQTSLSDRQIRWMQFLQQYDFDIFYKPGKENVVADALSRRCDFASLIATTATDEFLKKMKEHYQKDKQTNDVWKLCEKGQTVFKQGNRVFIKDETLNINKNGKILTWIPAGAKEELLQIIHEEGGHPGKSKLSEVVRRRFWWPQMTADVNKVIKLCDKCACNKSSNQKPQGLLQPLAVAKGPWERIAIDLITDLPKTNRGNDAILTVTDTFTKFVYVLPTTKTATAKGLADLLFENVLRIHGTPAVIVSDRDPRFISDFWKYLWARLDTRLAMSTAFHPQSDGQSERTNRTVIQQLRFKCEERQEEWDLATPLIQLNINNVPSQSTGFSPHFANFGIHPRMPPIGNQTEKYKDLGQFLKARMDVKEVISKNITTAQNRQKQAADKKRRPCNITAGQWVMLSTRNLRFRGPSKKLAPKYIGPFKVKKVINGVTCELVLPTSLAIYNVFHSSLLQHYQGSVTKAFIHPGFLSQQPIEEYEVEEILQHRQDTIDGKKQRFFLIKWKNADKTHSTWEPEGNLSNAKRMLREYLKKAK